MSSKDITTDQAQARMVEFLVGQGYVNPDPGFFHAEFTQDVWGDVATVYLRESWNLSARTLTYEVNISWSSTNRTLASAMVALENYAKAIAFAARAQAFIDGLPCIKVGAEEQDQIPP